MSEICYRDILNKVTLSEQLCCVSFRVTTPDGGLSPDAFGGGSREGDEFDLGSTCTKALTFDLFILLYSKVSIC